MCAQIHNIIRDLRLLSVLISKKVPAAPKFRIPIAGFAPKSNAESSKVGCCVGTNDVSTTKEGDTRISLVMSESKYR